VVVEVLDTLGYVAVLRFNHLHPPFNNAGVRRALAGAHSPGASAALVVAAASPALVRADGSASTSGSGTSSGGGDSFPRSPLRTAGTPPPPQRSPGSGTRAVPTWASAPPDVDAGRAPPHDMPATHGLLSTPARQRAGVTLLPSGRRVVTSAARRAGALAGDGDGWVSAHSTPTRGAPPLA
jgi:hypothetical protein